MTAVEPSPPLPPDGGTGTAPSTGDRGAVVRYLRFLGCDPHTAEDLCQDVLLEAVQSRALEQQPAAAGAAWLRTAARHRFVDLRRREARAPDVRELDAMDAVWERRESDGSQRALAECLALVGGRARRCLELRYGHGASRDAIARELGIGAEGVKSLLARVRDQLRQCIDRRLS